MPASASILGARRLDRLREVAGPLGATALELDVTDAGSVAAFAAQLPAAIHLLVNNAGGAYGLDRIEDARDEDWIGMWETNVLGVMRLTRALLPALKASGDGHVINLGSIAGFETYLGGARLHRQQARGAGASPARCGWSCSAQPVRVTEVAPGLVETEFSLVRFAGDEERAKSVYRGLEPLTRRGHRRLRRLGGHPPVPRQHRRDRRPPARPGDRHDGEPAGAR